ncbi:hypothetical protein BGZ94_009926, partial [Podila epigama]
GRAASLKRNVVFNYMPEKVRQKKDDKRHENRPQLWFLPRVKDRGIVPPLPDVPPPWSSDTPVMNATSHEAAAVAESDENAAFSASRVSSVSSTSSASKASSSTSSSPRTSRTSWSSNLTRPAFTMPSAPTIPLFSSMAIRRTESEPLGKRSAANDVVVNGTGRNSHGSMSDAGSSAQDNESGRTMSAIATAVQGPVETVAVLSVEGSTFEEERTKKDSLGSGCESKDKEVQAKMNEPVAIAV